MSKTKKILITAAAILLLLPVVLNIVVMSVNDAYAARAEKELKQLPLPVDTVYIESFSKAGKLSGNGNGMQYYGVMLITSELPLEQLQEYYGQYDNYYVYEQNTARIEELHGSIRFNTDPVPDNAYRVELWGESPSWLFTELDIRGH